MDEIDHKNLYQAFREQVERLSRVKAIPDDEEEVRAFVATEHVKNVDLEAAAASLALVKRLKGLLETDLIRALEALSTEFKFEISGLMWRQLHGDPIRTAILWSRDPPTSFVLEYPIWTKSATGNGQLRLASIVQTEDGFELRNTPERIALVWIEQFIEGARNVARVDQSRWSGGF
jgi:hypothetical protein